ncbi:uncharacterized protein LOC126995706 isoform X3 [Eriocheir sinensis]|uniref:uncharacterized protein LOC126995706 isoform X3 n=1 Tax=Eriocheir sinensis TaxID=95602 RepID=UPI0021C6099F|nr:uncharacterized protein LOC126995706 isoform X3 [Eriocheir sinensis]
MEVSFLIVVAAVVVRGSEVLSDAVVVMSTSFRVEVEGVDVVVMSSAEMVLGVAVGGGVVVLILDVCVSLLEEEVVVVVIGSKSSPFPAVLVVMSCGVVKGTSPAVTSPLDVLVTTEAMVAIVVPDVALSGKVITVSSPTPSLRAKTIPEGVEVARTSVWLVVMSPGIGNAVVVAGGGDASSGDAVMVVMMSVGVMLVLVGKSCGDVMVASLNGNVVKGVLVMTVVREESSIGGVETSSAEVEGVIVVFALIVVVGGGLVVVQVVVVVAGAGSLKNLSSSPSSPFKNLSSRGRMEERPGTKWKESSSPGVRTCNSLGVETGVCRRGNEVQWCSPAAGDDGACGRGTKVGNRVLVVVVEAVGVRRQPAVVVVVRKGTCTLAQKKNL